MVRTFLLLPLLLSCWALSFAAPLAPQDVPEPLRPWVKWVLQDHKVQDCPFLYTDNGQPRCLWPSRLDLTLHARGGEFSQQWLVFAEEWLTLPGEPEHWPQEVKINNQAASVTERDGRPQIRVQPGTHTIKGLFLWDTLPQALQIAQETGLVGLTLDARTIEFPEIDGTGKLWLRQGTAEQEKVEDRLELKVYRRITDEIPLMLTTRIDVQVSGKQREVVLGQALTAEYIPLSLNSPLPARLEPDGRLRVQVRAGQWSITLIARHMGNALTALPLPAVTGGPWPEEEIWVFEARPHLRQVTIDNLAPIDPQQTTLPTDWRAFPTYMMKAGDTLQFSEKKRGDPEPAPDQLTLARQWWLDFDGNGYTVQDTVSGMMTRGWRLDLNPPGTLGRVAVDGQEQFITKGDHAGRAGIELRRGQINLVADSRLDDKRTLVPAVGWDHDFHQVSGQLHLPPGWRVFTASGVDAIPGAWLERWTLWELFFVFLVTFAVAKLWNRGWGVVALITLVLTVHERGAPWWLWIQVIAAVALLRVLPAGWPKRLVFFYRAIAMLLLLLLAGRFLLQQAQHGLYPQLERPWQIVGEGQLMPTSAPGGGAGAVADAPMAPPVPMPEAQMEANDSLLTEQERQDKDIGETTELASRTMERLERKVERYRDLSSDYSRAAKVAKQAVQKYDPKAAIQTGPGLPRWQWTTLTLVWNGPVERTQEVHFILLSPRINMFLALLRIVFVLALVLCVFDLDSLRAGLTRTRLPSSSVPTAMLTIILLLGANVTHAQQPIPSPELLNELRERLLRKDAPECLPSCATSPRLQLEVSANILRLRQEIHTAAHVAVPLPGQQRHWLPRTVLLDGVPARGLFRVDNGVLWVELPVGQHQIVLEGPLPNRETVELSLPLKPRLIQRQTDGWEVEGVHEDGVADEQLQLRRVRREASQAEAQTLEPGTLPPFVRVERTLHLGLTWGVDTRVLRVSPRGTAAVLAIPLLAGESVTSSGVRVEAGKVLVNMAPGEEETSWSSVLETHPQLTLAAPTTTSWTEIWKLDVSPIWRVLPTGVPVIHHSDPAVGVWLPEWHPWPGETVELQITRPEGLAGQTLTIDNSLLEITPGLRATDARLTLSVRSSRGGQHSLTLPEGASLESVMINNQTQAIRQEGRTVTLPVTPGVQTVMLQWRQNIGMNGSFTSSPVDLGVSSVNTQLVLHVPHQRWLLFCGGPRLGPAVLFWPALVVIGLVAVVLGRVPFTPLRSWHWFFLGIGLIPVYLPLAFLVIGWLLALGLRKRLPAETDPLLFNFVQLLLAGVTLAALGSLFFAIQGGLMGYPDMHVAGNGSSNLFLRWYQDRSGALLPQAWVWSVPLFVYRLAMLAWALWLAFALIRWLRWGWDCFGTNGLWRKIERVTPPASASGSVPPAPSTQTSAE